MASAEPGSDKAMRDRYDGESQRVSAAAGAARAALGHPQGPTDGDCSDCDGNDSGNVFLCRLHKAAPQLLAALERLGNVALTARNHIAGADRDEWRAYTNDYCVAMEAIAGATGEPLPSMVQRFRSEQLRDEPLLQAMKRARDAIVPTGDTTVLEAARDAHAILTNAIAEADAANMKLPRAVLLGWDEKWNLKATPVPHSIKGDLVHQLAESDGFASGRFASVPRAQALRFVGDIEKAANARCN